MDQRENMNLLMLECRSSTEESTVVGGGSKFEEDESPSMDTEA
jgi:hypothetical protein